MIENVAGKGLRSVVLEILSPEGSWVPVYAITSEDCADPMADAARQFAYIDNNRAQYRAQSVRVVLDGTVMLSR